MNFFFNKIEKKVFLLWNKYKYFNNKKSAYKKIFSITIPPPNVTGKLHIGHVLNIVLQDILIRYKKMLNYKVSWIVGTDHASIATEHKIRSIYKNIKNKNIILKLLKKWSKKYTNIIINQLINFGCILNKKNIEYTLNKKFKISINKIFNILYKKKYIYKKYKFINWDYNMNTSLSNEEIKKKKILGYLYYIKYQLFNSNKYIIIATTKPETIYGDTAIGLNKNNKYYNLLKNKYVIHPILKKKIPIIFDNIIDNKKGSGFIKISPYNDEKDFFLYKKYNLKIINIYNKKGLLNKYCYDYKFYKRLIARKKIINYLLKKNKIINIEKYSYNIYYSEKNNNIIQKIPSLQWFFDIKKIISNNILNKINFYPLNTKKECLNWINNIKEWNISRNLIWGHKIPIYYYNNKEYLFINKNINKKKFKKDKNILDTWFSSCMWPSIIFNSINNPFNKKFKKYYPLDIIFTGKDILFCWIVRMIIMNYYFNKKIPFKNVFFTGIIKDNNNIKFSKSLNNVPNLKLLFKKYGIDNLRLGILLFSDYGKDIIYNESFFIESNKIIMKIKNIYKFIKSIKINYKIKLTKYDLEIINFIKKKYIYIIYKNNFFMKKYFIFDSVRIICSFIKNDFSNFFIKLIKKSIINNNINISLFKIIFYIYINILKLLHPIIPFITDYIYNKIYNNILLNKKYPTTKKKINIKSINLLKKIIKKIHNKLIKYNILNFNLIYFKKIKYILLLKIFFNIKKIYYKKIIYLKNKILPLFVNNNLFILIINKNINYNFLKKIIYYKKYLLYMKNKIKNKYYINNINIKKKKYEYNKIIDFKKKIFILNKFYKYNKK
ncbi:MAG: class I tRNA ligase family protein [Candidatus Shikimatogenerans sp. Tcar]|uniref:valine--tRNA ligase n=1 Tax=Candidatus Shikimatogenerans sp. Tcar TaxID=3158565 RepID=A0AAU7QRZ1_9FLAO